MQAGGGDGPYFDSLAVGDIFDHAPSVTLTDGLAATHHAILGGRFRLALDCSLSQRVAGRPLAAPAFAWDISIGQSTLVTGRAIANLFYRGLCFLRLPSIGDTLSTRTEITGLRSAEPKPGKPARGLAVMRIRTIDQEGRGVLDYHRCALLPSRIAELRQPSGELSPDSGDLTPETVAQAISGFDLAAYRSALPARAATVPMEGETHFSTGDLVSSAPELARLSLNLAAVHHDGSASADGQRLVYGGHTVGIAASQASRAFPGMIAILAWQSCDHIAPVREGDTLRSSFVVGRVEQMSWGLLAHIVVSVTADRPYGPEKVLDWRFIAAFA